MLNRCATKIYSVDVEVVQWLPKLIQYMDFFIQERDSRWVERFDCSSVFINMTVFDQRSKLR